MVSPGRATITCPSRVPSKAMPSVMCRVCPWAWECQAVRAPGVKCTQETIIVDGAARRGLIESTYTSPVNNSAGAFAVGFFSSIFIAYLLVLQGGSVGGEDALSGGHRGHGLGPAGVEGQVGDGLDQLGLGVAVLPGQTQVIHKLVGVPRGGQRGDGDQAALLQREARAGPDLPEQHVVGEPDQRGSEVGQRVARPFR